MSRSALTRHAMQKSVASCASVIPDEETAYVNEAEHTRHIKHDEIPIYGNTTTYNLNTLLYQNILHSDYFRQLFNFKTYHEIVDEIYYRVDNAEPLCPGTARIPSTCFCLLLKCFTMRLTMRQMQGLLKHTDSPYIRVVGFLYIRYACDPEKLWSWFEPYLDDPEEFNASANVNLQTTIGAWLKSILEENNYFGTILPRIPKKIQDSIKVKLLLHARKKERENANASITHLLEPGVKIRAMYADEDNEPAMYDAVIDAVNQDNTFWVTFPEYGNSEKVTLGDIELDAPKYRSSSVSRDRHFRKSRSTSPRNPRSRSVKGQRSRRRKVSRSASRSASRSRKRTRRSDRRDRSHSRSSSQSENSSNLTENLLQQVRKNDRRKAEAVGRDYAARPASYKGSLSLKLDRFTTRKRSVSPKRRNDKIKARTSSIPSIEKDIRIDERNPQRSKEAEERLKKLRELYGDASSKREEVEEE